MNQSTRDLINESDRVIKEWDDWMNETDALLNSIERNRRRRME